MLAPAGRGAAEIPAPRWRGKYDREARAPMLRPQALFLLCASLAGTAAGLADGPPAEPHPGGEPGAGGTARPVPPKIEAAPHPEDLIVVPSEDGDAMVLGLPGAAGDERARIVRAVNLETADQVAALVRPDGSFRLEIFAPPGTHLQISTAILGSLDGRDGLLAELRAELEAPWGADPGRLREELRARIESDPTSSPGLILPISGEDSARTGFARKLDGSRWLFGSARLVPGAIGPGGRFHADVEIVLRSDDGSIPRLASNRRPELDARLSPLFDRLGRQMSGMRLSATHVLTPTGIPIETHNDLQGRRGPDGRLTVEPGPPGIHLPVSSAEGEPWSIDRGGRLARARLRLEVEVPPDTPAGTYRVIVGLRSLEDPGPHEVFAQESSIGTMVVGDAEAPRLACLLLGSAGTGGSHGAIAREDLGAYGIAPRNVLLPEKLVVPRDDPRTGRRHVYPLDPYLPLVSLTDRPHELRLWPPRIAFDFAGASLRVSVTCPDGEERTLGPAPLVAAQCDLSSLRPDRTVRDRIVPAFGLAYGNPSLADIYHLTGHGAFDFAFERYGPHTVTLSGGISDAGGLRHRISGTYDVHVARPLDIDVFPEPGTPLRPRSPIRPQVRVLPPFPAEVDLRIRHLPRSDPARTIEARARGRANRWGVFVAEGEPIVLDEPGEYVCDVTVRHVEDDGTWWMASRRGASVVATPGSGVTVHGERGTRSPALRWRPRWFAARDARYLARPKDGERGAAPDRNRPFEVGHTCFPYEPGDVAWLGASDPDSLFPSVTFEDPSGDLSRLVLERWPAARQGAGREGLYPRGLLPEDREAIGEMPFVSSSATGLAPSLDPGAVDRWGYFYATSWRPGVSVRSHAGEDLVPAPYWFFDDVYGYQFGVGPAGDLPGDFKMNYAGTVLRDAGTGAAHYGAYASMLVIVDPETDPRGRRVLPPFDGLLPGTPPSGPLLEAGGKRHDAFLTFGAVAPGAVLDAGDRLAVSGVVWPPVAGLVSGRVMSPGGETTRFEVPCDAMGLFSSEGIAAREPGVWTVRAEAVLSGRTSAGRIADLVPRERWPRGAGLGLDDGAFPIPVVAADSAPIELFVPPRASPPRPLAIRGRLPEGLEAATAHVLVSLPGEVIDRAALPVTGREFVYLYDPEKLSRLFPNIDLGIPSPDPREARRLLDAWYDTVTITFWCGEGVGLRAGAVLLQGEDVHVTKGTGKPEGEARSDGAETPVEAGKREDPAIRPAIADPRRRTALPFDPAGACRLRTSLLVPSPSGDALYAAHRWSGQVARLEGEGSSLRLGPVAETRGEVRSLGISPDGSRLYAALSDRREIVVLDGKDLAGSERRWPVPGEPWAALPSRDGASLFVADFDGDRVLLLDALTGEIEAASAFVSRPACLARLPGRDDVCASSFLTGDLAVLGPRCEIIGAVRAPPQLEQCRSLAIGPDGLLYAPQIRADTILGGRTYDRTVFPVVAVADPGSGAARIALFPDILSVPVHRPCEAILDASALYLASAGSDDVLAIDLATGFPRWHARDVGEEPGGIAIDPTGKWIHVLTLTGEEVVTLAVDSGEVAARVHYARDHAPREIVRGRYLFGTATDPRLTKDRWISCAACHPDGDADGRRWDLGQGPLDTRSLRGAVACAPLHYTAHLDEIQDTYEFTRRTMAGRWFVPEDRIRPPLGESNAGESGDLDALAAYIGSLEPRRPPPPPPELAESIRKGREIFFRDEVGCARCHPPPRYTDSGRRDGTGAFLLHDVGTWREGEPESVSKKRFTAYSSGAGYPAWLASASMLGQAPRRGRPTHPPRIRGCGSVPVAARVPPPNPPLAEGRRGSAVNDPRVRLPHKQTDEDCLSNSCSGSESFRALDTPSLLGLRRSEPYLHDGRAPTLESVLGEHNPTDRHGRTSGLGAEEIRALVDFLRHLEPP
jgi:cytochrome c peroxidase